MVNSQYGAGNKANPLFLDHEELTSIPLKDLKVGVPQHVNLRVMSGQPYK